MDNLEVLSIDECLTQDVYLDQLVETLKQYSNFAINGVEFDYQTEAEKLLKKVEQQQDAETLAGEIREFFQKYLNNGGVSIEEVNEYLTNLYKEQPVCCGCCETQNQEVDEENSETYEIPESAVPALDSPEFNQMCEEMEDEEIKSAFGSEDEADYCPNNDD